MEEEISGPWRATRLWNTIIRNFRTGMPLKKHKRNLRTYENCFSSTDAVDWLHKSLQKNPNFGADVSKEQTILLLKKLLRAGIIENVREDSNPEEEFKASGELYRFSSKSPAKNLRTPGKERKPLADTGNTPRTVLNRDADRDKVERDESVNRKSSEEMKKQLNLSYFQALPSNSLIMLDNDDTWRRVFSDQLSRIVGGRYTERLDYAGQLDMENIMHNMTKVSSKGIVQVEEKHEELPHWVLSAMKCLANWPRQLRTVNGKESCLPNYPGFEHDVFNVVKDYFLGLPGPLSTYPIYEFFIQVFMREEEEAMPVPLVSSASNFTGPASHISQPVVDCGVHPGSVNRPCTRPYTQTNLDGGGGGNSFYTMAEQTEDFSVLSHQERVARIRQTFEVLPPLATSSVQTSHNTNSSSGHSTFDTTANYTLTPDMSTTAIMKQFLPPNTCFETAFVAESPITRIVPQKEHETLHIKRSWSGRSLSHIQTDWATKSTSTQTEECREGSSLKRIPKWKRTSRFRKSIAVMESQDTRRPSSDVGIVNSGFSDTPEQRGRRHRQLYSTSDLPDPDRKPPIRGYSSVDNLLDREAQFEKQFMLKYRQVSGDLRASCDLVELSRERAEEGRDKSFIQSKAVRKEKKKKRYRSSSTDRLGYDTDNEVRYKPEYRNEPPTRPGFNSMYESSYRQEHIGYNPCPVSRTDEVSSFCYVNGGLETSPLVQPTLAPLALHEISDLSPVPFNRHAKYNASYRLATNQPNTPALRPGLPRTSTRKDLMSFNRRGVPEPQECVYARAEPYLCLNSDGTSSVVSERLGKENLYTCVGQRPIQRYSAPVNRNTVATNPAYMDSFHRNQAARASRCSQATVDSGRYSDLSRASVHGGGNRIPTPALSLVPDTRWARSTAYSLGADGARIPAPAYSFEANGARLPAPAYSLGANGARVQAPALSSISDGGNYSRYSKTVPPNVLLEKLKMLARGYPERSVESTVEAFKLLTLLIPPSNRRKLQLLLKFIRKVSVNAELRLDPGLTNRDLSLKTFTTVILRPVDLYSANQNLDRKIALLFIDKYDEIWSPPQSLRREVEEKVYLSLVNRRIQAGEDPYPVTFCRQVTKVEYEKSKLTGAETALLDLLQAILVDTKMTEKEKIKKLKRFKESYPDLWRRKFPSENSEPDLIEARREKTGKFSSLSRLKSVMRI